MGRTCICYAAPWPRHDPSLWHGNWAVLQLSACGLQRALQDMVSRGARMAIAMMMMMMHPQQWYR
jgi:hypothetical protein